MESIAIVWYINLVCDIVERFHPLEIEVIAMLDLLELEAPRLAPRPPRDPRPRYCWPLPRVLLPPGSSIIGIVDHEESD